MSREFKHLPLNQEFEAIGGSFMMVREELVDFEGRPLLYLVGFGVYDTSCCGAGGSAYALVVGWLLDHGFRTAADGMAVSLVEPLGENEKERVSKLLRLREKLSQINFWPWG